MLERWFTNKTIVAGVADLRGFQVAVEVTGGRLASERSVKGSRIHREVESLGRLTAEVIVTPAQS